MSGPTGGWMDVALMSAHPHSRVQDHDGDVGQDGADRGQHGAEGGDRHDAVDVVLADGVDEIPTHPVPAEDRLGEDRTGEDGGDAEGELGRDGDERRAQSVPADGLLLCEALRTRRAHVVGLDVVEQERALEEVIARVADDDEGDRREREMLQLVEESGEEPFDIVAAGPGDVEDPGADQVVEPDREEDDAEGRDDDVDVHRDDGGGLTDAVAEPILPRRRVDAEGDAEDGGDDGRPEHELRRDPHTVGDLLVDGLADRAHPPVPVQDDVGEPRPPALEKRDGVAEVAGLEDVGDLVLGERGATSHIVAARIEEGPRKEVGQIGRHRDHEEPAEETAEQVLDQDGVLSLSQTPHGVSDATLGPTSFKHHRPAVVKRAEASPVRRKPIS
ncbi:hypothetical protein ABE10_10925 [Bacillus toyonensis]|nr:hypothetical protein [Bacillus toyonensis]